MATRAETAESPPRARVVLLALAAYQFLMALDSSVMNVSIATVAEDVDTTVTGVQGAITAYTLVMAMLMIPGGKVGALIGRKRAFMIGCVIYGCGSLTTALAPNLPVLLLGWSFLEGVGAALILPAIVALVASNFAAERRAAAYGLVAAAGAVAIAVGPLVGGVATTYFSWRWVFAGEVVMVLGILVLAGRIADAPVGERPHVDLVGALLSALGLGLFVYGVLRSDEWGWFQPKPDAPSWLGVSLVVWLMLAGLLLVWLFLRWEARMVRRRVEPLIDPAMLRNRQLTGGLTMFFFQYLVQMGVFFVVPLYLSVALGLSALETGARILPLSVTLLAAAVLIPRLLPDVSPRRVVQLGVFALLAGAVVLMAALDADSRRGDRHPPPAADRARDGRAGIPARGGHGVRGARGAEHRGRRRPERRHQPRRLDRNGARRIDPDRHDDDDLPRHRGGQSGSPVRGQEAGDRRTRKRRTVPVGRPAEVRPGRSGHGQGGDRGGPRRERGGQDRRSARRAGHPRLHRAPRDVLHLTHPEHTAPFGEALTVKSQIFGASRWRFGWPRSRGEVSSRARLSR